MQLSGKRILVTGGGRGIGRAIAQAFASEGAAVCVTARRADQLAQVVETIATAGGIAIALPGDVTVPDEVQTVVDAAASQLGGLDILINNAGGGFTRSPLASSSTHDWRATLEVNLLGAYYAARAVIPHLVAAGGGKIINIGSGMGHQARAGNSAYNGAKAGLWMMTRCLALELWEQGIEVNELVPGPVFTDLTADTFPPPGQGAPPLAGSERVKTPEECVPLALFLATQPPGGPTGQSFSLARRPMD